MATIRIALLRGLNVGGKNRLPMRALAATFEEAGCTRVRTYIQSGNVVFEAPAAVADGLATRVRVSIRERFAIDSPVILRSARELERIGQRHPFERPGTEEKALAVAFLDTRPSNRAVAALEPDRSPGDSFAVRGSEIYLHLANGAARTRLTNAWFDARLGTVSTVRNWRTVRKLAEMTREEIR